MCSFVTRRPRRTKRSEPLLRGDVGAWAAARADFLPLARQEIESRENDDRRAGQRPRSRHIAEHEIAAGAHPDQSEINEGREQRGGCVPRGEDEQPMPEPAPESE